MNNNNTYGKGPWYVCTLKNNVNGMEQTRVHTYCFRIPAILNELNPQDDWILMSMIGPYSNLHDAIAQNPVDKLLIWKRKEKKIYKKRVRNTPLPPPPPSQLKIKDVKRIKKSKK